MRRFRTFGLIAAAVASGAVAHGVGNHPEPGWNVEPVAGAILVLSVILYSWGLFQMTGVQRRALAPPRRVACYWVAVGVIVLALFSPLDSLADRSFAWHMAQHLLLMLAAAPLLAFANTHLAFLF
ncbi:MAG TPA: cytochrome c oxidase assembly protein, partial [Sphingomicrobium sp.]|nr:cytochrome c oxidase assembly protein [Sphingomicrobium sp.]